MKRRWLFVVETDQGVGYLLETGGMVRFPDEATEWVGTSPAADIEAKRRMDAYDQMTGGYVNRIIYESKGRA